jgi:hypothetical protein
MIITGKRPEGYIVECTAEGERHVFVVKDLGTAVTCPTCGHEEPSLDLASNFVFMRHALKYGKMAAGMVSESVGPVQVANDYLYHRHTASGEN